jgi:hypothetical protein
MKKVDFTNNKYFHRNFRLVLNIHPHKRDRNFLKISAYLEVICMLNMAQAGSDLNGLR